MKTATETLVRDIPLSKIVLIENYRKAYDKKKMDELTESIRKDGVVQPVLCRPVVDPREDGIEFELVYGSRRFKASLAAERETIPSMIRICTDEKALELQILENGQREDPNPMEEANGFKRLLDLGHHTTETLAAKLDKSLEYVLGRLKLLRLPNEVQAKMLDGTIQIGHALQMTRLKNVEDMKRLLEEIIEENLGVQATKDSIRSWYGKPMSDAEFDTKVCANCESRSRNQKVLFPDLKKDQDLCLDQSCFVGQAKAQIRESIADQIEKGVTLLETEKEIQKAVKAGVLLRLTKEDPYHVYLNNSYHPTIEPKTPAQCKKCATRAFYLYEHKSGRKSDLLTGWICSDKPCFHKMNGIKETPAGSKTSKAGRDSYGHGRDARDRFIYSTMLEKVQSSEVLRKRLLLYQLINQFDRMRGDVLTDQIAQPQEIIRMLLDAFVPGRDYEEMCEYAFSEEGAGYAVIAEIPAKNLDTAITRTVQAMVRHTDADVLFRMMPEAGVKFEKSFTVDREYLNSFGTEDFPKLVKELGIKKAEKLGQDGGAADQKFWTKEEWITVILRESVTGKVPREIADQCKIESLDELCPKVKSQKGKAKAAKPGKKKTAKPAACDGNCDDCAQSDGCDQIPSEPGEEQ